MVRSRLEIRRSPLSDYARAVLQPALDRSNTDWDEVDRWLGEGSACLWEINRGQAFVLTVATEREIEGVLAGGTGAREWAAEFGRAMKELPEHEGRTLVVNGRRGWRRLLTDWNAQGAELRF